MYNKTYPPKNMSIYYTINCSIWFDEYQFTYTDYVNMDYASYLSRLNNILTSNCSVYRSGVDAKLEIFSSNCMELLSAFTEHYDMPLYCDGVFDKWIVTNIDSNSCKITNVRPDGDYYKINNVNMFKNIVEMMTIIFSKVKEIYITNFCFPNVKPKN